MGRFAAAVRTMSAQIYWGKAWREASEERVRRGKAPRLSVRRAILLRQGPNGNWIAGLCEWRFGICQEPTWLCAWTTLAEARTAALDAWEAKRLPLLWAYHGERRMRPFFRGLNEPSAALAHVNPRPSNPNSGKAA